MIDGFRSSFIGESDGSLFVGIIYLSILALLVWFLSFIFLKKVIKLNRNHELNFKNI